MQSLTHKISPKYFFLHLFAILMLYVSTANLLTLVFQYINKLLPDNLISNSYINDYSSGLIRFAIASIIIVYPAFIWASWMLNKYYLKNSEIREMKIRKWLIYFTIFISGLAIVCDAVDIVWTLLGGEITTRFVLKAFFVLLVSALIFGYYFWEAKREKTSKTLKYFALAISTMVLFVIILGFFFIGSPKTERMRKFDEQRVSDLTNIQWQIINYWQSKEKLPNGLNDLQDSISGFVVPIDPEANRSYEYIKTGDSSFSLCANFNLPGINSTTVPVKYGIAPGDINQNWDHSAGRICFERKIDKDLYPFKNKN